MKGSATSWYGFAYIYAVMTGEAYALRIKLTLNSLGAKRYIAIKHGDFISYADFLGRILARRL
jgi:hypothetical protein